MPDEKMLYIWLEGHIENLPDIHVKAEKAMSLEAFRSKYVDDSKSHVILRVHNAEDDHGNSYKVELHAIEAAEPAPKTASDDEPAAGSLTLIKGIGRKTAALFQRTAAVDSIEMLVRTGATSKGRAELAEKMGKPQHVIRKWVQLADLMRVHGIGEDYALLLWQTGITAIPELGQQNPEALERLLENVNQRLNVVHRLPAPEKIEDWIIQAQILPSIVE